MFHLQIDNIVSKANKLLGFIYRQIHECYDLFCLKSLYVCLVRSSIEYCSIIWFPHKASCVKKLEAVQRRFTRLAMHFPPLRGVSVMSSYRHRFLLLGLQTLQHRQKVNQSVFVIKLINNELDAPSLLVKPNIYAPVRTLRVIYSIPYLDAHFMDLTIY